MNTVALLLCALGLAVASPITTDNQQQGVNLSERSKCEGSGCDAGSAAWWPQQLISVKVTEYSVIRAGVMLPASAALGEYLPALPQVSFQDQARDTDDEVSLPGSQETPDGDQNKLFEDEKEDPAFMQVKEKKFDLQSQEVNWFQAFELCRSNGKMLASISNEEENNRLKDLLYEYSVSSVWLSGSDLGQEGRFKWMSTGEPLTFMYFVRKGPDNWKDEEHCVHMNKYNEGYYSWNDINCNNKYLFVCEYY